MQFKLDDFEAEKIKEKEKKRIEDQKVMDLLGRYSAQMLRDGLIKGGGHPKPEWGHGETWRYYYQEECERRGRKLLRDLGWPDDEDALYVNISTGSVQTLLETAAWGTNRSGKHIIDYHVWSVIELWEPYDPDKPNIHRIRYLEGELERLRQMKTRKDLDSYDKQDIKRIPEIEKEIALEKAKGFPQKVATA